jgi:hypothetical protein
MLKKWSVTVQCAPKTPKPQKPSHRAKADQFSQAVSG